MLTVVAGGADNGSQLPTVADTEAIARGFRRAWPSVIRALAGITGSLDDAEEYAAVAFERAAAHPGHIDDLAAWCVVAGRRAFVDDVRRAAVHRRITGELARDNQGIGAMDPIADAADDGGPPGADGLDDRVALLFVACDEALPPVGQMVLALRLVCGLTVPQIAAHLGIQDAAAAARLTRSKRALAAARGTFRLADDAERVSRLPMVLACVAGMHTHGHRAALRPADATEDISAQALSIADSLVTLYPADTEVHGLRAVIRLGLARRPGRLDDQGVALPLDEVDRSRWDRTLIHAGLQDAAIAATRSGRFALEAAIAGKHCVASDLERTDWATIETLYGELLRRWPSPAVEVAALIARAHRLRFAPGNDDAGNDDAGNDDGGDRTCGGAGGRGAAAADGRDDHDETVTVVGVPASLVTTGPPADPQREVSRRLEHLVDHGPAYAARDASLALADIDWHAGRRADAAARYADLADLLDGPMRAFCLRRVREATPQG